MPGPSTSVYNEGTPGQVTIGDHVTLLDDEIRCYSNGRVVIGDYVWMSLRGQIICAERVEIGTDCIFGRDVYISDTNEHPLDSALRRSQTRELLIHGTLPDRYTAASAPVHIEDGAWIGERAVILKGVTIGQNAVVAAGSVVTKSVPPDTVAAGNPARVVKQLERP